MINTISNGILEVSVNSYAAELFSIRTSDQTELLWQGDEKYWPRRAPVMFPIVGSLPEGRYIWQGREYKLDIHGFAKTSEFELVHESEDELLYRLMENEETLKCYPFRFEFHVGFKLVNNCLRQTLKVINPGDGLLPFTFASHPAFRCPLVEGEAFEDYKLVFEKEEHARRRLLKNRLVGSDTADFLVNGSEYSLRYDMFDPGAVILEGLESSWVQLQSKKSGKGIRVEFTGFPYLFLWSPEKKEAPFICIEPSFGIGSTYGSDGDLMTKEGMLFLEPGKSYQKEICLNKLF